MNSKPGVWEQDSSREAFSIGTSPTQSFGVAGKKTAAIDLASLLQRCLDDTNLSAPLLRARAEELEAAAGQRDLPRARRAFDQARAEVSRCTALVPELMDRLAL